MQTAYIVYILECTDGTFYTGITTDLDRRLREHQSGAGARYTKSHGAVRMVYRELCADRSAASKRESIIKHLTRAQKEDLIAQYDMIE